ncbi:MAG: hypothetical protein AAFX79_08505 [Planctomycetota bacterium]
MTDPEPQAAQPADDTRVAELVQTLSANPQDFPAEQEFWKEFCELPSWYFAARPADAQAAVQAGQSGLPLSLLNAGDKKLVPVFTSPERAQGVFGPDEPPAIVEGKLPAALGYVCGFRGRADGFVVNAKPGESNGYGHFFPDLCAFYYNVKGSLPPACLDCAVDHARKTRHPQAIEMVHRVVASLEMLGVATTNGQFAYLRDGERLLVTVFSEPQRLATLHEKNPNLKLARATPEQLLEVLQNGAKHPQTPIAGAALNHPDNPFAINTEQLAAAIEAKNGAA